MFVHLWLRRAATWNPGGVLDGARHITLAGHIAYIAARAGLVVGLSVWWKKLASDGKNANEVTSQRLTDMGRARKGTHRSHIPLPAQRQRQTVFPDTAAGRLQHQGFHRPHVVQRLHQMGLTFAFGVIQSIQAGAEKRQQGPNAPRDGQSKAQNNQGQRGA